MNEKDLSLVLLHEELPDDDKLLDELIALVERSVSGGPAVKQRSIGKKLWRVVSNLLFYGALLLAILAALVYGTGPGEVKDLLGYSYFTVMTPSMQSSIPQGSLIITRRTEPADLAVGDVITFFSSDGSNTVTHRIIEIISGGELQFRTKGDDNPTPDSTPIAAGRVVGKVLFHVKHLGSVMLALQNNLIWVLALFFLAIALSFTLQQLLRKD